MWPRQTSKKERSRKLKLATNAKHVITFVRKPRKRGKKQEVERVTVALRECLLFRPYILSEVSYLLLGHFWVNFGKRSTLQVAVLCKQTKYIQSFLKVHHSSHLLINPKALGTVQ